LYILIDLYIVSGLNGLFVQNFGLWK